LENIQLFAFLSDDFMHGFVLLRLCVLGLIRTIYAGCFVTKHVL